jgi:hypothetical protein
MSQEIYFNPDGALLRAIKRVLQPVTGYGKEDLCKSLNKVIEDTVREAIEGIRSAAFKPAHESTGELVELSRIKPEICAVPVQTAAERRYLFDPSVSALQLIGQYVDELNEILQRAHKMDVSSDVL